jgi:glycosyltransferase involved in cell wall biosynthesis
MAVARNRGVAEARADVIMLLDHDDLWVPQKIEWQMDYLRAHPDVGVVAGHMQGFLDEGGEVVSEQMRQIIEAPRPFLYPSVLAFRRDVFMRIGEFNAEYDMASDFEWIVRLKQGNVDVHMLPQLVCHYRIHATNASRDLFGMQREMLRIVHRLRRSRNSL